jgi:hypothetical protein
VGRNLARYGFLLIGTYLVVAYATGAGKVISSATSGTAKVVKTLQARA